MERTLVSEMEEREQMMGSTAEEVDVTQAEELVEFDASAEDVDSIELDEDVQDEPGAEDAPTESAGEAEAEDAPTESAGEAEAEDAPTVSAGETEVEDAPTESTGETEAADEVEVDDGRRWYVIHSYSGYENKVKRNLSQRIESMEVQDQIFEVIVPTIDEMELHDGKRRTVSRRVFPGYILVQMIMSDDSWYVVRNTPGVTGFVGMGNKPTPLSQQEVDKIMQRIESDIPQIRATFSVGQQVRIVDGPFAEFVGSVDEVDEPRTTLKVLVSFFGRETPVELDYLQVEKV